MSRGYLMKEIVGADTRFLNDSELEKIKKNISSHRITPLRNI